MAKFSANFWSSEFCSTAGFDTLVKRLKEGKKMCQDFEEFLEKRARIEKDYGESLIRLAKVVSGKDEIGTLRRSWDQLKTDTENIGKLHVGLAQKMMEELHHSLREFRDQQRDKRKRSEDTVKRSAAHKKTCFERNNRLKATYEGKCRDADRAEEHYNRLQATPTTKAKDIQSAQKSMEAKRATANAADQTYKESVKNLEEGRQLWEREMEILCTQFQELEEQRVAFLRHKMWTYCNLISQTTVHEDEACENVRQVLEDCNVDSDIDVFVFEKKTGSDRPASIPYENYYHPTQGQEDMAAPPAARTTTSPPHKELPPIPAEEPPPSADQGGTFDSVYSSIAETTAMDLPEGYYASPKSMMEEKVIAVYNYEAQGGQELNLTEGAIIKLMAKEDDVWWCGELDGQVGMFPSAYVEPYEDP